LIQRYLLMKRATIERRLAHVGAESHTLREELKILEEQLQHFVDEADDARIRSLVSETPQAVVDHREAAKAVGAVKRDRDARLKRLAKLEAKQDSLLDQLQSIS